MSRITSSSSGTSNVNISDSAGNPLTSTGGALDVNVLMNPGTAISVYNEITGVAIAATATVLNYTVPPGQILLVKRVLVSSDSKSTVVLNLDGSPNAKGRLYYTQYNLTFNYGELEATSGTTITLVATNNSSESVASFNATLQGVIQ